RRRPRPPPCLFPYTTLFRSEGGPPQQSRVPDAAMLPRHEYKDDSRTDDWGSTSAPPQASPEFRPCRVAPHLWASIDPTVGGSSRSEEHTSELQSRVDLVCRL